MDLSSWVAEEVYALSLSLHLPHETCTVCDTEKAAINMHYNVQAVLKRTYMRKLPIGWAPLVVRTAGMQRQGLQLVALRVPIDVEYLQVQN